MYPPNPGFCARTSSIAVLVAWYPCVRGWSLVVKKMAERGAMGDVDMAWEQGCSLRYTVAESMWR
jgi:hypothetical protein